MKHRLFSHLVLLSALILLSTSCAGQSEPEQQPNNDSQDADNHQDTNDAPEPEPEPDNNEPDNNEEPQEDFSDAAPLPDCGDYCNVAIEVCINQHDVQMGFDSLEECLPLCEDKDLRVHVDFAHVSSGDTRQCRVNHLELVDEGPLGPQLHCQQASIDGGLLCRNFNPMNCPFYCRNLLDNCPEVFDAEYPDGFDLCVDGCSSRFGLDSIGDIGDLSGNTIGCRSTFAFIASQKSELCLSASAQSPHCQ